ncbi:MAG: glycosyltransferase [Henriciella sp.]|nr:glycosyltransferase [Henriciella sp.]
MSKADVSIVIATKNRSRDLQRALNSAISQNGEPEIIVIDDGSDDDTQEVLKQFPTVRVIRHETSAGCVARRNEGARLARSSFILSIDDDAELSDPNIALQVQKAFSNERIGAVAIPCIEPLKENRLFQISPDLEHSYVIDSFMGTAYAARRDIFNELGGFRESIVGQGEERDYCIRLMNRGFLIGIADAEHIIHYESPIRNWSKQGYRGRRNHVLFAVHNAPASVAAVHVLATTFNGLVYAARVGPRWPMIKGLLDGWLGIPRALRERHACRKAVYRLSRRLRKSGPMRIQAAEQIVSG